MQEPIRVTIVLKRRRGWRLWLGVVRAAVATFGIFMRAGQGPVLSARLAVGAVNLALAASKMFPDA